MALTTEQFNLLKVQTSISRKSHPEQYKAQLIPVEMLDVCSELKRPAPSEYQAEQWYSADKSIVKVNVLEWACKPY